MPVCFPRIARGDCAVRFFSSRRAFRYNGVYLIAAARL